MKKMDTDGRNVYLVEIGPKSLGDARQDFCKDKECNLGPELSCIFLLLACPFFEGNIQCAKEGITSGVSHGMR